MKKKLLICFIIIFVFASTGYSRPRIDTSSDEKMKASITKVRESLPENRRHEFDEAFEIMFFSQVDLKYLFAGTTGVNVVEAKIKQSLNGKTAQEIIAQAAKIKKERNKIERQQVISEKNELKKKQIKAQDERQQVLSEIADVNENEKKQIDGLAKFQIIRSRFYKKEQEFSGDQTIIELTVKNNTQYPISRAYFKGTLRSPGRSVPWFKGDFNFSIPGGLEPGEEAEWHLAPIMGCGGWEMVEMHMVEMHDDAILTVEVEQLNGADDETLLSIKDSYGWAGLECRMMLLKQLK